MPDEGFPIGTRARVKVSGLTLDLARAQLETPAGDIVELRPQALAVLCHLAQAVGEVVTKEELFAAVWPHAVVTDDSLVQAIGDARRALGPTGHRSIRTVPRRGYMLVADVDNAGGLGAAAASPLSPDSAPALSPSPAAPNPLASTSPARTRGSRRRFAVLGAALAMAAGAPALWWGSQRENVPGRPASGRAPVAPTIAVLPFASRALDGSTTWIGEGLAIGITSALTRLSGLPVLSDRMARDPSRTADTYAAEAIRKQATHLLSGSVQSDAQRVRATVQLMVAASGLVVWSEHYDRPLAELFALEDEIIAKTVVALQVKLTDGEQARSRINPKGDLQAWELATRGYERFETGGPAPLAQARRLLEEALQLDPDYAWARAYLAATCFLEARFGFVTDTAASMKRAFDEATRAVRTDPGLPDAWSTLGSILLARREFAQAVAAGRRAVELGPNDAEVHAVLAQTMLAIGQWAQSIALSERAIALTGRHPAWYLVPQCYGQVFLGRFDEALTASRRMLALAESPFLRRAALVAIAFAQVEAGRIDEARRVVAELVPLRPGQGAATAADQLLFENPRHAVRLTEALRVAGLPA